MMPPPKDDHPEKSPPATVSITVQNTESAPLPSEKRQTRTKPPIPICCDGSVPHNRSRSRTRCISQRKCLRQHLPPLFAENGLPRQRRCRSRMQPGQSPVVQKKVHSQVRRLGGSSPAERRFPCAFFNAIPAADKRLPLPKQKEQPCWKSKP